MTDTCKVKQFLDCWLLIMPDGYTQTRLTRIPGLPSSNIRTKRYIWLSLKHLPSFKNSCFISNRGETSISSHVNDTWSCIYNAAHIKPGNKKLSQFFSWCSNTEKSNSCWLHSWLLATGRHWALRLNTHHTNVNTLHQMLKQTKYLTKSKRRVCKVHSHAYVEKTMLSHLRGWQTERHI